MIDGPGSVSVQRVRTRQALREFVDLPLRLHPRERYVPLWQDVAQRWFTGTGPHTEHGALEMLLVRDAAGVVIGRSTVHTDTRMDARLGQPAVLLGATEFTGGPALTALTAYAQEWGSDRGCTTMLGPVSLLPNQVGGVLTSGFEERGFVDSAWNPQHYPTDWEGAGFTPVWPAATWICAGLGALDPDAVFPRGIAVPEGVRLHHGSRRRLGEQLPVLRSMLNASFAELAYYTPITSAELDAATDGLAWLLDEPLLLWATRAGEPVAFVLTVPDVSGFVMRTGGRLSLVDQVRLLLTRWRYRREAVLIIKGTVPAARGAGLMSLLAHRLLQNLQAGGYETLRVTFVGEDNPASAAQFRAMGGRPLHGITFYRRPIDG